MTPEREKELRSPTEASLYRTEQQDRDEIWKHIDQQAAEISRLRERNAELQQARNTLRQLNSGEIHRHVKTMGENHDLVDQNNGLEAEVARLRTALAETLRRLGEMRQTWLHVSQGLSTDADNLRQAFHAPVTASCCKARSEVFARCAEELNVNLAAHVRTALGKMP